MKEKMIPLTTLKLNDGSHGLPKNPRFIKDDKFKKLCDSLKADPEFMTVRGIVVEEHNVILGGNMRYRACMELGMTEIPASWVKQVKGWTLAKKRAFIIKDNMAFGEMDWELLSAEFEIEELTNWGFDEKELMGLAAEPSDEEHQGRLDQKTPVTCPKCGHSWSP